MEFILEPEILKKAGLSIGDFGLLIYCMSNPLPRKFVTDNDNIKKLWTYGFLDRQKRNFTLNTNKLLRIIINMRESSSNKSILERAKELAPKLMEVFPDGRKQGTNLHWKGNRMEITNKLRKFLSAWGSDYTDEDIIEATTNYVKSFNGNYAYMRVLKYFIWKNVLKIGESSNYVEEVSDLLTWLERKGADTIMRDDWMNSLV